MYIIDWMRHLNDYVSVSSLIVSWSGLNWNQPPLHFLLMYILNAVKCLTSFHLAKRMSRQPCQYLCFFFLKYDIDRQQKAYLLTSLCIQRSFIVK